MKITHRVKAIDSYKGARVTLNEELVYPSYMLIKESLRSTLAYILEDLLDIEISNKRKINSLVDWLNNPEYGVLNSDEVEVINIIIEAENGGLSKIIALNIDDLKKVKKIVKKLISTYMDEHM